MRVNKDESRSLLFLLCFLMKTGAAMKNDATEIVYPYTAEDPEAEPADEAALNRARGGGRGSESAARDPVGECARASHQCALNAVLRAVALKEGARDPQGSVQHSQREFFLSFLVQWKEL